MKNQKPNYSAWSIDINRFPKNGTKEQKLRFLMNFGVLAPSVHNTQPWIFEYKSNSVLIKNNTEVSLSIADSGDYFQWFAIGMFIENVDQAAKYYGYKISIKVNELSGILMELQDDKTIKKNEISAVLLRKSDKRAYKDIKIDKKVITNLHELDSPESVEMTIKTKGEPNYSEIIDLHMKCVENVANNKDFVRELAGWTRSNFTKSYDGMPGFVMGMPALRSILSSKILAKKPELFKKVIPKEKLLIDSASGILVIGVKKKNISQMVNAGIYAERAWLGIIRNSMVGHPMTAIVHSEHNAEKLKKIIKTDYLPVFFMRFGYPIDFEARNTPRRHV